MRAKRYHLFYNQYFFLRLDLYMILENLPLQPRDVHLQSLPGYFIVCDTRKDYKGKYEGSLWQARNIRMTRKRDGKYVDLVKIPDGQILGGAKNIWVIFRDYTVIKINSCQ